MNTSSQAVFSLYRSYLRQTSSLPIAYLRQFFYLKARDEVAKILSFKGPSLRARNIKTVSKAIKRIQKANQGDVSSFQHVLDLAYGRKGKLKWELLGPLLYPKGPLPSPIIPGNESSRPPVISPELRALLTSPYSRTTKPLSKNDVIKPRDLPSRADPLSLEARIYGPLSKRREVNIRQRFFKTETKKLLPPLDVRLADPIIQDTELIHIPTVSNFQGLQKVESVVGELFRGPTRTRRERKEETLERDPQTVMHRHSSRWVRRRYRWLLSRLPQLVYGGKGSNSINVQISSRSLAPFQKTPVYMPEVDPITLAWFQRTSVSAQRIDTNNS